MNYPLWQEFQQRFDFKLDPFQQQAAHHIEAGDSTLVAAPTGAGKTVAGEFAVFCAVKRGLKVFYTTPIKALSNQKYRDLCSWLGEEQVGLLTGDVSKNSEAPVVVMTTEVLRNMLYAQSRTLHGLGYVVMDEVHYLSDPFRGPVWEEIILQLPDSVALIGLSATVSNVEEFGAWLKEVRGNCALVVSEHRPVPLWQDILIGNEVLPVFVDADLEPVASHGPDPSQEKFINPELDFQVEALRQERRTGLRNRSRRRFDKRHQAAGRRPVRRGPLERSEVIECLDEAGLLPAIYFIFSRKGCEIALQTCARNRLSLTTKAQAQQIARFIDEKTKHLSAEDADMLRLRGFRGSAMHGFAAHHAGMLPLLKEIVEELFSQGLLKVVFATETLALGINMPARSVVLDKLSKFNGIGHIDLTPGEFTQLTGRAGRRGIDMEGHAVVVASGEVTPDQVAALASRRTYPLKSAFKPTYNMAVNLLDRLSSSEATSMLEQSFAQFQADRSVVKIVRKVKEDSAIAQQYFDAMACERGDFAAYGDLMLRISEREKYLSRQRAERQQAQVRKALQSFKTGDVIVIGSGKKAQFALVTHPARIRGEQVTCKVITVKAQAKVIAPGDLPTQPIKLQHLPLGKKVSVATGRERRDLASKLRATLPVQLTPQEALKGQPRRCASTAATDKKLQALKTELKNHACHDCPDKNVHLRWLKRYESMQKAITKRERMIDSRTSSVGRTFNRVCELLHEMGYLEPGITATDLVPTQAGVQLQRIYSERDLLIAECVRQGIWSELSPAQLAVMASAMTYDARRESIAMYVPDQVMVSAWRGTNQIWQQLQQRERHYRLSETPAPTLAVAEVMQRWASGAELAETLEGSDFGAGDFVRQCRQVVDLLQQLTAFAELRENAQTAVKLVRRGLIADEIGSF